MIRKMLLALAIAVLPIAGAHALGLGGISLQSRLNEPLDAEIELRSVEPGDLEKLRVGLASNEEFEQAGLERPFLLASLKFQTVQRGDKTLVKVTTRDSFREPFLSFLLKVEWPNGRLLREYTLLLDPPVLTRQSAPAVQAPAAQAAPQMAPAAPTTTPSAPMRAAPTPRAAPAPRVSSIGPGEYRVNRGDNLYTIAQQSLVGDGVSSQQAMLAYLRANPEAFINDNINLLKEGYVLRVPTADEALSVSQAEAVAEVRRQMAEWRTYRQARASGATQPGAAMAAAPQPRLEVVAPERGEGTAPGTADAGDGTSAEVESIQKELALATEASEARRLENEELRGQVVDLEEKLAEMQRLVTVKVDELAALQARLQEAGEMKPEEAASESASEQPATPATESMAQPEAEKPAMAEGEDQPAEAATESAPAAMAEAEPEAAMEKPAEVQPAAPASEPAPQPTFQPPAPEPGPMGFLEDLLGPGFMDDPVMLGGIGGGILLLILLLFMMLRRRGGGADEAAEQMTEVSSGFDEAMAETEEEGASFLDTASDMEVADFEEPEEPETAPEAAGGVDQVIAEADVYLAYGRYQQAEELIKGAIADNPGRTDLQSKLLEVYFATRDRDSFEALAQELHSSIESTGGAEWDKYMLMGKDLCPDNPLFAGAAPVSSADESGVPSGALDTGIEFDPFADSTPVAEDAGSEGSESDMPAPLEFDLGEEEEELAAEPTDTVVEPKKEEADDGALDFDFDFGENEAEEELDLEGTLPLGSELEEAEEALEDTGMDLSLETEAETEDESEHDDLSLDFDIGGEGESTGTDLKEEDFDLALHTIQTEAEAIEKEIADEGAAEEAAPETETGETEAEPSMVGGASSMMDERDFSIEWDITGMGLETPEEESAAGEDTGEELSRDDLENTAILDFTSVPLDEDTGTEDADMVATKLDLAKAYIDMGDSDGARNILDEVAKEGNESQRQEAEQLLSQL